MGYPVVMTVDPTLSSQYHGNTFFGFGSCLPSSLAPEPLMRALAWPTVPARSDGSIGVSDGGSRRIEAALRRSGFGPKDFHFAHPSRLGEAVGPETKVLLVGSHDPLGRGPLVRLMATLFGQAPSYGSRAVEGLLHHESVRRSRPVVIVGGGGAWEWASDPEARRRHGVDCVVVGEGEISVPKLVHRALAGEDLPEVVTGEMVAVGDIPRLLGPTSGGVVEVTRGCGRGCQFCTPNLQTLRSLPVEDVMEDVKVNLRAGLSTVAFHAEDIFRYGAVSGFRVAEDAVLSLFEAAMRLPGVQGAAATHATLAGALESPELLPRLSRLLELGRPGRREYSAFQVGIETGSPRLAQLHLAGKMAPFAAEDWPEVVRQGAAKLWENRFYAAYTLIVGLPGETEEDLFQTTRLVRQLRGIPSLIFPLFHVPMTAEGAANDPGLMPADVTAAQAELLVACAEHDSHWMPVIWGLYGRRNAPIYRRLAGMFVRALSAYGLRRARRVAVSMGAPAGRRGAWHPGLEAPPARELVRRGHRVIHRAASVPAP